MVGDVHWFCIAICSHIHKHVFNQMVFLINSQSFCCASYFRFSNSQTNFQTNTFQKVSFRQQSMLHFLFGALEPIQLSLFTEMNLHMLYVSLYLVGISNLGIKFQRSIFLSDFFWFIKLWVKFKSSFFWAYGVQKSKSFLISNLKTKGIT